MSQAVPFQLKKPIIVYTLAICFLLAMPFNLSLALLQAKVASWYSPGTWFQLFLKLSYQEKVLIALLPVAGIFLFVQKKTSWFLAILVLVAVSIHNISAYFIDAESGVSIALLTLINMSVLLVFYFFRFPYLDQRDHILAGVTKRYDVSMEVPIEGPLKSGTVKNISVTGCYIHLLGAKELPPIGSILKIHLENTWLECEVVHHRGNGVGLKFVSPGRLPKKLTQLFMKAS